MRTKTRSQLTLRDRLSRLSYTAACKLLGPEGEKLIRRGGGIDIDPTEQVTLSEQRLTVRLPDAEVSMALADAAAQRLEIRCGMCPGICAHAGAALAFVLEEKMLLGLAAPPRERRPVESLDEAALTRLALEERAERARNERMRIEPRNPESPWTDYLVGSKLSGKTYRVALRGTERGVSFCSCPDFRKNTLGTCKHILHLLRRLERRFPADVLSRPYKRKELSLYLRYGATLELRLACPPRLGATAKTIVEPLRDRPITDLPDLLVRIQRLQAAGQAVKVHPDAEEYLERRLLQTRLAGRSAEIRRDPAGHHLRTELLRTELLPYQLDGIAFAVGAGRAVLADDMGLGKTIQGIGVAELLAREAGIRKVLVVCPTSLKAQWRSEIARFSGRDCQLVNGSAAERGPQYSRDCFFTICNYEQVLRDLLALERVPWDLIVLDEGQRIKNWETETARVIKGLRSRFALVLSGTPLENRLDELHSVVEFIDDRRLGPAFRFMNRHRVVDEKGKVLGYRKLDELREMLAPILLRRTREAVLAELPPRTTEVVRIAPTEEQLVLHNAHKKVVASIVQKKFISEMDLLRLRMALLMCRLAADSTFLVDKQEPGYSSKLERLDELFERLAAEPGRKVLLFSEWTGMLDLIEPQLERRRLRFVRLDGSVPQKKRAALVHQFQHDPGCAFFLATNAGSTGLNLQAANTVINVDLPWNPAVLEQRVARAHRMGQEQPVHVYVLVTEDTLEDSLLTTLGAKKELALAALDPESEVDAVDLASGVEELKRRLEVLLGARAEAPLDESEKARVTADAERAGRRDRVAAAAGQMLSAALSFLGELLPAPPAGTRLETMAAELERGLHDCARRDEQGRMSLTLTLPGGAGHNGSAHGAELAELALSLARIAAAQGSSTALPG